VPYAVASAAVGAAAGAALGVPWLYPAVTAAAVFPLYHSLLRAGRWTRCFWLMLLWAFSLSAAVIVLTLLLPERMEASVLRGRAYVDEMFTWISTGEGPEGDIGLFWKIHLRHYLGVAGLSALTGGALALILGSVLMDYMSFYVGHLFLAGGRPVVIALMGWPIWSVLRVAGFVATAVALGALLYRRLSPDARRTAFPRRLLAAGVLLVLLDALLKHLLAPPWRSALRSALGL
jgi:hypothetical protein